MGFSVPLWSFWQLNGDYSSKFLLATVDDAELPCPEIGNEDHTVQGKANYSKKRLRDDSELPSRRLSQAVNGLQASAFKPINAEHLDVPYRRSSAHRSLTVSSAETLTAQRSEFCRPSFNSLYDVTPKRASAKNHIKSREGYRTQHRSTADVLQFKVSFDFPGSVNGTRKSVRLDSQMGFPRALAHLQQKLERQLTGGAIYGVCFKFEADQRLYLVDEEDMWAELLLLVETSGAKELIGIPMNDGNGI